MDYSADRGAGRTAQLARLDGWSPPSWGAHLEILLALVGEIDARAQVRA
ncbi:MAG: hypothetical protein JF564_02435 [Sphingomonas sp.]|nr:hypothetical protein [Sphingomonas sp.]